MDIVKLKEVQFLKETTCGIWSKKQKFGLGKQETRTKSRNLQGSK